MPMLWAFVLVAIVRGKQFDAVTWSSISHTLQSSSWPLVLQSDAAVGNFFGKNVRWRVFALSQVITFTSVCLIVAHFLTPLPLVEIMRPTFGSDNADFAYAPGKCLLPRFFPEFSYEVLGSTPVPADMFRFIILRASDFRVAAYPTYMRLESMDGLPRFNLRKFSRQEQVYQQNCRQFYDTSGHSGHIQ